MLGPHADSDNRQLFPGAARGFRPTTVFPTGGTSTLAGQQAVIILEPVSHLVERQEFRTLESN
jgi:hypothetical protein